MAYPCIKAYFEQHIDGKRVGRKRLSRSFVQGFARMLLVQMQQATAGAQNNTAGSSQTMTAFADAFTSTGALDTSTRGIVVGTGSTAVAATDTALGTQIATGNSSGQLRYLAQTFNALSVSSPTSSFSFVRAFINNSGGSITVNEVGVYAQINAQLYCIIRDLTGGVAVAAGKTYTITYTITVSI